ncbi:protein of unknown function [Methylorubrum extorquens]|uniref:Uncharacterized protein n=1 Tax=Methylorubrum extorquens TaxID=408 RepID=A0A2N9AKJ9_METEX|nr:hypothetical protein [Methylorubrum zatmanii]SOR27891.1 protein of unknown function [Methylorubrum extorquens]
MIARSETRSETNDPERVVQEAEATAPDIPDCGNAAREKGVFRFRSGLCAAWLALGTSVGQGRKIGITLYLPQLPLNWR